MCDDDTIAGWAERYVALWNETDPARRRREIGSLWAEDGVQYLPGAEYRGHEALLVRVTEAHEQFVAGGGFVFRYAGDATGHHRMIRFTTDMVPGGGGPPVWRGAVVATLDGRGRIRADFQSELPVPESTRASTAAAVATFLDRSATGSPERIAALYAPEVEWRVSWPVTDHPAVPWIRPRSTRADVADHFHSFARVCPPADGRVSVDQVLVDGEHAVIIGTSEQRVAATGRRFAMAFALRLTVRDGLIVRHHMYEDSLAVASAFRAEADG